MPLTHVCAALQCPAIAQDYLGRLRRTTDRISPPPAAEDEPPKGMAPRPEPRETRPPSPVRAGQSHSAIARTLAAKRCPIPPTVYKPSENRKQNEAESKTE